MVSRMPKSRRGRYYVDRNLKRRHLPLRGTGHGGLFRLSGKRKFR